MYGGKAVQTVLYSISGTNNVICGFQPSDKGYCIVYLHHITPEDSEVFKLEGKGGGNRHVKLRELTANDEKELRRLIELAKSRAGWCKITYCLPDFTLMLSYFSRSLQYN